MKCIYCCIERPDEEFTDEHIIPRQLGTFQGRRTPPDPITIRICGTCHSRFNALENRIAVDSWEGLTRLRREEAGSTRFQFSGRVQLRLIEPGIYHGAHVWYVPQGRRYVPEMRAQAGFPDGDERIWVPFDQMRSLADLELNRYGPDDVIYIVAPTEEAGNAVVAEIVRVVGSFNEHGKMPPPPERPLVEQAFDVGHPHRRWVAKIAFNYLAATAGRDFVLASDFDAIRAYITHGKHGPGLGPRPVEIITEQDREVDVEDLQWTDQHRISVDWRAQDIVAQVTLYNDITYEVQLCRYFRGAPPRIAATHRYDVRKRRVERLV
ncbi:MAG: hypothetical protein HY320_00415 [Armatimonadetes bacterium]|nr:hypothetical protein [Armatimonadota bacterium]